MGQTHSRELAEELCSIEEADAWFEYLEETRGIQESRYSETESWAWAKLQRHLKAVKERRDARTQQKAAS